MPRPPIAQVTQDRIVELAAAGYDNRAIAKVVGVADTTVGRYRRLAPSREPKDNGSLKRRLLHAIVARDFDTVGDLTSVVRTASDSFDDHEVIHILWSLQKQGLISFRETKVKSNGPGGNNRMVDIRATRVTPASIAPFKNGTEASVHATVEAIMEIEEAEAIADGFAPVHTAKPEAIEVESIDPEVYVFPLLSGLRAKAAQREANKVRLAKYVEAAELLALVDPTESERLFNRAAEEEATLSPIEAEYLAYAEAKEGAA